MHEDQRAFGVDVLLAQREQLLRPDPAEKRGENQCPVPRLDSVEQPARFLGRDPTALLARSHRLQASIGRVDPCAERGVHLDPMLTQRVAEDGREAADRPVDGGLRQAAR
jgi:hypothetical protein